MIAAGVTASRLLASRRTDCFGATRGMPQQLPSRERRVLWP